MRYVKCRALLQKSGWLENAVVGLAADGTVAEIRTAAPAGAAAEDLGGCVIPGFQNAHSHAFQYAMAGMAEQKSPANLTDDFWSWRDAMYRLALRLTPDEMQAVATQVYAEMLRFGITNVAEFHYLHNAEDGKPYANPAEMSERLLAAAQTAGIHLTLVPVLYRQGGFGKPPTEAQRRFINPSLDAYLQLVDGARAAAARLTDATVGYGVHSLRAASPDEIRSLFAAPRPGPVHLHIAEQQLEVHDSLHALGKRPVAWLLENVRVDARFNLVHATHLDAAELRGLAKSGATVVICPSTEANLGDGFFPLASYLELGGRYAIGSDSQVTLNPLEELRWLDYGQRLRSEKRHVLGAEQGGPACPSSFAWAWERGRMAVGQPHVDYVSVGSPFDGVVLDPEHPALLGKPAEKRLGALVYAADASAYLAVYRRGQRVIERGLHIRNSGIKAAYAKAMEIWARA